MNKVYLKAAEKVATGEEYYCCHAIRSISNCDFDAVSKFHNTYLPEGFSKDSAYFSFDGYTLAAKRREHRILALLLMQELVDCGDLP